MITKLEKLYDFLYPKKVLGFRIQPKELVEKINIICVVSKYLEFNILKEILESNNFKFIKEDQDFYSFKTYFSKNNEEGKRINIPVIYYFQIIKERSLLLFFTTSNKYDVEQTLGKFIERADGFYYSFLSPNLFEEIKNEIFKENPNTVIPYFTSIRKPHYKIECKIRPKESRSFTYRGTDGRETLEELKYYYGMLPQVIHFKIPNVVDFKIDYKGIFTFQDGDISYINHIIDKLTYLIANSKRIIDKSKFEYEKITTQKKELLILSSAPWSIMFDKPITFGEVDSIIEQLSKESRFKIINSYAEVGSLFWSATVTDYQKNSIFNIRSNGNKIIISPRYNNSFDSFLRFYQFFLENIKPNATIEELQ